MAYPEKKLRNNALVRRRERDPSYWTFSRLGRYYGIRKLTAYGIYRRAIDRRHSPAR